MKRRACTARDRRSAVGVARRRASCVGGSGVRTRRRTSGSTKRASSTTRTRCRPDAVDKASDRAQQAGRAGQQDRQGADAGAAPREGAGSREGADAQRAKEEIARRDRALVASYTNEAEIDLARNRSLQTINNVILSSQAFSEQLTKRKVDVETKKVEVAGQGGRRRPRPRARKHRCRARASGGARRPEEQGSRRDHREVRRRQAAVAGVGRHQGTSGGNDNAAGHGERQRRRTSSAVAGTPKK